MLREVTRPYRNVTVDASEGRFLVDYARRSGAEYLLRGIRNEGDDEYERTMRYVNGDLDRRIATVFLIPPREFAEISASFGNGFVGPRRWKKVLRRYVSEATYRRYVARTQVAGPEGED